MLSDISNIALFKILFFILIFGLYLQLFWGLFNVKQTNKDVSFVLIICFFTIVLLSFIVNIGFILNAALIVSIFFISVLVIFLKSRVYLYYILLSFTVLIPATFYLGLTDSALNLTTAFFLLLFLVVIKELFYEKLYKS